MLNTDFIKHYHAKIDISFVIASEIFRLWLLTIFLVFFIAAKIQKFKEMSLSMAYIFPKNQNELMFSPGSSYDSLIDLAHAQFIWLSEPIDADWQYVRMNV